MFTDEGIQATETELGFGVTPYDDLDCFAGAGKRRKRKKRTRRQNMSSEYQAELKKIIRNKLPGTNNEDKLRVYKGFIKYLIKTKNVNVRNRADLLTILNGYMSFRKIKKKRL